MEAAFYLWWNSHSWRRHFNYEERSSVEAALYLWENGHSWRRHFTLRKWSSMEAAFYLWGKVIHGAAFYLWGNGHPWRWHFTYEETLIHGGSTLPMRKRSLMEVVFYLEEMVIHGGGILPMRKRSPMEVAFYLWGDGHPRRLHGHPWRRHVTDKETVIHGGSIFVLYSTLLHLLPLRFHCADGCWDRTQDLWGSGHPWRRHFTYEETVIQGGCMVIHGGGMLPIRKRSFMEAAFLYCIQHCFICCPSDSTVPTDAGIEPRTFEEAVIHGGGILPMRKRSSMEAAFYLWGNGHPWRQHFTYEETVIHGDGILPMRKRSSIEAAFYLWGNVHPWRRHWSWSRMTGRPPSWAAHTSASGPCFLF